LFPSF
jgi:hypothetical protein